MTERQTGDAAVGTCLRPRRRPRRWTTKRRTDFLEALAETCNVTEAARRAKADRNSAYDLKERDPDFAEGWLRALEQAHGELELHLLQQARDGTTRTEKVLDPETGKAKQIKQIHSYPLTVAMRLFLSHREEVALYRLASAAPGTDEAVGARVLVKLEAMRDQLAAQILPGVRADDPADEEAMAEGDDLVAPD